MANSSIAKLLIVFGVLFILAGIGWHFGWIQQLRLGRLPGDITFRWGSARVYFPITTCLLASAIFIAVSWIIKRF
jgi:hypothetical protein